VYLNIYLSGRREGSKVTLGKIILQNYFLVLPIIKFELLASFESHTKLKCG
jgi:hypothetical protein